MAKSGEPMRRELTIALAGNPNSGKTSLFNALTGLNQHVGNWPGVSVERKEGHRETPTGRATVIDLPGTYSLTAQSDDERIALDSIMSGEHDIVVAVVDASNLERNLYLVVQLIEVGVPLVIALNMVDIAEGRGLTIDAEKLSHLLDVPVVRTCAHTGKGVEQLWATVLAHVAKGRAPRRLRYGRQLDEAIEAVEAAIARVPELAGSRSVCRQAIDLLTGEAQGLSFAAKNDPEIQRVSAVARAAARHIEDVTGDTVEAAFIDGRYGAIAGACREAVSEAPLVRGVASDRLDRVLLHRVYGMPVLLAAVAAMFALTFIVGAYPSGWIEAGCGALGGLVGRAAPPGVLRSLIVDGVIGGVGGVLVFLPQICILFALIATLEDSGYMARAAFLMDRTMHHMRLHGKAFIPLVMGFGCNVPAIMATRTLESPRDRIVTILIAPLMSCSARLPVYALIAGSLFGAYAGLAIASMYGLGLVLAAIVARLARRHVLPGEEEPFVMELPPYHRPTLKGIATHTWERGKLFLQKAGTLILAGSILIWFLSAFPWGVEVGGRESYAGRIGQITEPVVRPLGLSWREGVALMSGFVAKEVVVSTMGVLYGVGPDADSATVGSAVAAGHLTPLGGYALMAFVLIYSPCIAVVATVRRETASWKWPLALVVYLTSLAWAVAFIIYQGGRALGLE